MRKIRSTILMLAALPLLWTACGDDDVAIGEAGDKLEGINATWVLTTVNQTDLAALISTTRDISSAFIGDGAAPQITFNSTDFTYTVNANGRKNFFGSGGSWAFYNDQSPADANFAPEGIVLNSSDQGQLRIPLAGSVRPQDTFLKLQIDRTCEGAVIMSYVLEFVRQ